MRVGVFRGRAGRWVCVLFVATSLTLAGCLSDEGEKVEAGPDFAEAPDDVAVTAEKGSISGSVTSDLFEPLAGALVTVVETGDQDMVAKNGFFTFNDVEPGAYVLYVTLGGYVDARRAVNVAAGAVTEVYFQLVPAAGVEPWSEEQEIIGNIATDVRWQISPGGDCLVVDTPVIPVRSCSGSSLNPSGVINQPNVTDDVETALFEAFWSPAGPLGENLYFFALCPGLDYIDNPDYYDDPCFMPAEGLNSPLHVRVDRAALPESVGMSGIWYVRLTGGWGLLGTYDLVGVDFGVTYQQKVTQLFSFFHHAPAPEGYTAVPDV